MREGGGESSEADAIRDREEGTQMQLAVVVVRRGVEVEVLVNQAQHIVLLPRAREEVAGEDGESLGVVDVAPVEERGEHVHDEQEANKDVEDGEEGCPEGGSQEGGGCGPVQCEGPHSQALEAGSHLVGGHGVRPRPAHP